MLRSIISLIKFFIYLPLDFWNFLSRPSKAIILTAIFASVGFFCFFAFDNNPGTNNDGVIVSSQKPNVLGQNDNGTGQSVETPASPAGRQFIASGNNTENQNTGDQDAINRVSTNIAWHAIEARDIDGNSITSRTIRNKTILSEDLASHLTIQRLVVDKKLIADNAEMGTIDLGTNTITDGNLTGNWNFGSGNITTAGTLTIGAVGTSGDLDMGSHLIENIGNAGTDFNALGGLTLANGLIVTTGGVAINGASTITGILGITGDLALGNGTFNNPSANADLYVTGNIESDGTIFGNLTGNITGNATGNAGTVTNGVYTTGDQTIAGTKTFSSTITGSITGNSGTVTNGVYSSGTYSDPTWLSTLGGSKVAGNISGLASGISGTLDFSKLTNPTASTALAMNSNTATFTFGNATGSNNLFNITDTAGNTGTGILLNITTGNASLENPFRVSASNGTFPAIAVNSSGQVGLGTNNPYSQLSVVGGATFGATYSLSTLADGYVAIENRLGIGTTSPAYALDINGGLRANSQSVYLTNLASGTGPALVVDANGQVRKDINVTGTVYANGGERVGDYYCQQKAVSAAGRRTADWTNINAFAVCGLNKRCDNGSCIVTSFACGTSQVLDADGNTYNTVLVDQQCWMATNLNVGTKLASGATEPTDNGQIEKWCYGNDDANCTSDGGLYNWDEAMQYSTTPGAQGICPTGWHVPTDAQQYALENYLKDTGQTCDGTRNGSLDCSTAGTKLKSGGTSGLNFPLAGLRLTDGSFANRTSYAYIWSSSEGGASSAWSRALYSGFPTVGRYAHAKAYGFSVRCLKD